MTVQQTAIPIQQLDNGQEESFYIPAFQVYIQGQDLPLDVVRDVMEVTYRDNVNEIDSFELRINNWDAENRNFKYTGRSNGQETQLSGLFDPGHNLQLYMGYLGANHPDNMRLMIEGQITTLSPDFPASGGPSLSVSGLNVLHTFRKTQHTWAWDCRTDSSIAVEMGGLPQSDNRPGLNIPVVVDPDVTANETPETFVFMNGMYDIVFLLQRARIHGYTIYLDYDENKKPILKYGYLDASRMRDVTYNLEWGRSLIQFKPTLTTSNQISKVTVRGWDRTGKKPISYTAKIGDKELGNINNDQTAVISAIEGREEVITDQPVFTLDEAKRLAIDTMKNQLKGMVTCSASTVGLPDLRAGRKVIIKNLGNRFSGQYFVTSTTHTINNGGYVTTFEARREKGLE